MIHTGEGKTEMKIFNMEDLRDRLDGDKELMDSIIRIFLADLPKQMNRLREAFQQQDTVLLRERAHALKGAAGNVGAEVIHKISKEIEAVARGSELATISPLLDALDEHIHDFQAVMAGDLTPKAMTA